MGSEPVWKGAAALRPFLVAIDGLEPFPGNPRRGDVQALRESLARFGQVLPALADPALAEGGKMRLVARHHLALAAASMSEIEGESNWTHIAVVPNEFADENEARAYLLADNRIPELGGYDGAELVVHLTYLAELDALTGTGYTTGDLEDQLAALRRAADATPPGGDGRKREHRDPGMKELVLNYSAARLDQVNIWMSIVAKEKGTTGTSETVYAALETAARLLNG